MVAAGSKCRVCRGPAIIDLARHNANFCAEHFLRLCRDQVAKAIDEFAMIEPGERVLVAVSGGKDSTYQVIEVLEMGYRPLTVTWSACAYTEIGRQNIESMQKLGVDHIQFTPNPKVYRAMFAEAFKRVGDGCWPCHVGIFSYPVRVAVNYKVPLIIYGAPHVPTAADIRLDTVAA